MQIKNIILSVAALAIANAAPVAPATDKFTTCAKYIADYNRIYGEGKTAVPSDEVLDMVKDCDACYVNAFYVEGQCGMGEDFYNIADVPEHSMRCYKKAFTGCDIPSTVPELKAPETAAPGTTIPVDAETAKAGVPIGAPATGATA